MGGAQYCGGVQYHGDIMSTVGGYLEYREGCSIPWGCSVPWGDIMSTVGDIMSTVGDIMSTVGDIFCTQGYKMECFVHKRVYSKPILLCKL